MHYNKHSDGISCMAFIYFSFSVSGDNTLDTARERNMSLSWNQSVIIIIIIIIVIITFLIPIYTYICSRFPDWLVHFTGKIV